MIQHYKIILTDKGYVAVSDKINTPNVWSVEYNALGNKVMGIVKAPSIVPGECILTEIIATDTTFKLGDLPQFYLDHSNYNLFELGILPNQPKKLVGIDVEMTEYYNRLDFDDADLPTSVEPKLTNGLLEIVRYYYE